MPRRKSLSTCAATAAHCPLVVTLQRRIGKCRTDSKVAKQTAPGPQGNILPGAPASQVTLNTAVQIA